MNMKKVKNEKIVDLIDFLPSMKLVAGAHYACLWKPKNQAIRTSQASIISWVKQKNEFSRGSMEKALGLNTGQVEWHIKEMLKKGIIKRTRKLEAKVGKGQRQVIYKYIP